jgi:hypothetical protein
MTTDSAVLGNGTTNTSRGTVAPAKTTFDADLLLLNPKDESVLVVPKEHAKAFIQEANQMAALCDALTQSRQKLLTLEEALATAQAERIPPPGAVQALQNQIKQAQKAYEAAYAAVKKELGDKGYLATSGNGKEMLELIPLAQRKQGGKPQPWARKWTYVRSDKVSNHWRSYQFNKHEKGQPASFVKNGKIDGKELKNQLSKLEPKLKAEWTLGHTAGFWFPELQSWAEQINKKSEGNNVSFEYGVQLFRYFAGCAASTEWNPRGGKIAAKFNGKAELMILSGKAKVEGYLPAKDGWVWTLTGPKTGKEFHIGAVRFFGEAKLEGACGASASAELGLEVDYSQLTGKSGVKGARRKQAVSAGAAKTGKLDQLGAEAGAGADLFAGAKLSGELTGALQYKSPDKGDDFGSMAQVGPKVEAQFGAGAAAALLVHYEKGKFRLKAKAGVCLGPGAKGEIGLEVDAKRIYTFMEWLFRALLNANFEALEIFTNEGYEAAKRLQAMWLNGISDAYNDVNESWRNFNRKLELEDQRIALMSRVLKNPPELRLCVPEAHGIMLYQLSRHSWETKLLRPQNTGWSFETMAERKKAVMQICRWAQSKRQFENMVQHIGPNGEKGGFQGNLKGLLRFMEIGLLDSQFDDALQTLYWSLPSEPPRGHPLALNDSIAFRTYARMGNSQIYMALLQGKTMPLANTLA